MKINTMTPKEKAMQLKIKFFILPEQNEGVGRLKGRESNLLAKQCALIAVDEILDDYRVFNEKHKSYKVPSFWQQVKEELQKL